MNATRTTLPKGRTIASFTARPANAPTRTWDVRQYATGSFTVRENTTGEQTGSLTFGNMHVACTFACELVRGYLGEQS